MNANNFKIVDLTYLNEMADGESSIIKEMIDIFKSQVVEFVNEMRSFESKKDWMNLSKVSHKAKSSVAIMGMSSLAEELKTLELMAKKGENTDEYPKYIAKFEEQCNLAVDELNLYYNSL